MRVGVIPTIRHGALRYRGIPHASGGDPNLTDGLNELAQYSPCEWG